MRTIVAFLVILIAATAEGQEKQTRWNVAFGPSGILGHNGFVPPPGSNDAFTFQAGDPIITGANQGRFNLGVGLTRPLAGSLQWRLDLLYILGSSAPATNYLSCDGTTPPELMCSWPRAALRDELVLGTLGFQWDALPKSRWSPYLLTTAGVALSRLQWSRDHTSSVGDETTTSRGVVLGYGMGARFPLWRYEGFVETRRHRSAHIYSSKFVPLSIGVRF